MTIVVRFLAEVQNLEKSFHEIVPGCEDCSVTDEHLQGIVAKQSNCQPNAVIIKSSSVRILNTMPDKGELR